MAVDEPGRHHRAHFEDKQRRGENDRHDRSRRFMSTSSGFGASSSEIVRGSSAIPQIGHEPGPGRTISGCIGHVYSTPGAGGRSEPGPAGAIGS